MMSIDPTTHVAYICTLLLSNGSISAAAAAAAAYAFLFSFAAAAAAAAAKLAPMPWRRRSG